MELLFVYEDKVACDDRGIFYTGSTFSQSVFDRYLRHFSHIVLLARHAEASADVTGMNPLDPEKVSVVFLPNLYGSVRNLLNPQVHRQFRCTIRNELKKEGRAVIVRVPSDSGAIAAGYCKKHGKPFLAEVVGCPWDSLRNHSMAGKLMAPIEFLKQRRAVRNAPYVVYVTNRFLQQRYPTKGCAAGISDVELQPMEDEVLTRRLQKIANRTGKMKIGTAGAVNISYKGQQYVIEALAQLKKLGNTGFEYHLAGGGEQTALRSLAEKLDVAEQVVFEGALPHDRMFAWLDELDLYVQPSLVEGLPRAVVEAMSRGLPCLGSDVGGLPELLDDAARFRKGSVSEIARMLDKITTDQLERLSRRSFNSAKSFEHAKLKSERDFFYSAFVNACEVSCL